MNLSAALSLQRRSLLALQLVIESPVLFQSRLGSTHNPYHWFCHHTSNNHEVSIPPGPPQQSLPFGLPTATTPTDQFQSRLGYHNNPYLLLPHTWPRHRRRILALNPCRSFLLSEQGELTEKQLLQAEFPSPEKKS